MVASPTTSSVLVVARNSRWALRVRRRATAGSLRVVAQRRPVSVFLVARVAPSVVGNDQRKLTPHLVAGAGRALGPAPSSAGQIRTSRARSSPDAGRQTDLTVMVRRSA